MAGQNVCVVPWLRMIALVFTALFLWAVSAGVSSFPLCLLPFQSFLSSNESILALWEHWNKKGKTIDCGIH